MSDDDKDKLKLLGREGAIDSFTRQFTEPFALQQSPEPTPTPKRGAGPRESVLDPSFLEMMWNQPGTPWINWEKSPPEVDIRMLSGPEREQAEESFIYDLMLQDGADFDIPRVFEYRSGLSEFNPQSMTEQEKIEAGIRPDLPVTFRRFRHRLNPDDRIYGRDLGDVPEEIIIQGGERVPFWRSRPSQRLSYLDDFVREGVSPVEWWTEAEKSRMAAEVEMFKEIRQEEMREMEVMERTVQGFQNPNYQWLYNLDASTKNTILLDNPEILEDLKTDARHTIAETFKKLFGSYVSREEYTPKQIKKELPILSFYLTFDFSPLLIFEEEFGKDIDLIAAEAVKLMEEVKQPLDINLVAAAYHNAAVSYRERTGDYDESLFSLDLVRPITERTALLDLEEDREMAWYNWVQESLLLPKPTSYQTNRLDALTRKFTDPFGIDLEVPRNIDGSVSNLDGVVLGQGASFPFINRAWEEGLPLLDEAAERLKLNEIDWSKWAKIIGRGLGLYGQKKPPNLEPQLPGAFTDKERARIESFKEGVPVEPAIFPVDDTSGGQPYYDPTLPMPEVYPSSLPPAESEDYEFVGSDAPLTLDGVELPEDWASDAVPRVSELGLEITAEDNIAQNLQKLDVVVSLLQGYLTRVNEGENVAEYWADDLAELNKLGYLVQGTDITDTLQRSIAALINSDPSQGPLGKVQKLIQYVNFIQTPEYAYQQIVLDHAQSAIDPNIQTFEEAQTRFYEVIYNPPEDMGTAEQLRILKGYNAAVAYRSELFKKQQERSGGETALNLITAPGITPRPVGNSRLAHFQLPATVMLNGDKVTERWNRETQDVHVRLKTAIGSIVRESFEGKGEDWRKPENLSIIQQDIDNAITLSSVPAGDGEAFWIDIKWDEMSPYISAPLALSLFQANIGTEGFVTTSIPPMFKTLGRFLRTNLAYGEDLTAIKNDPAAMKRWHAANAIALALANSNEDIDTIASVFGLGKERLSALRLLSKATVTRMGMSALFGRAGVPGETLDGEMTPEEFFKLQTEGPTAEQLARFQGSTQESSNAILATLREVIRYGGNTGLPLSEDARESIKIAFEVQYLGSSAGDQFARITKANSGGNGERELDRWWRNFTRIFPDLETPEGDINPQAFNTAMQDLTGAMNITTVAAKGILNSLSGEEDLDELNQDELKGYAYHLWGLMNDQRFRSDMVQYTQYRLAYTGDSQYNFNVGEIAAFSRLRNERSGIGIAKISVEGTPFYYSSSIDKDWIERSGNASKPWNTRMSPANPAAANLLRSNFRINTTSTTTPLHLRRAYDFNMAIARDYGMSTDEYNSIVDEAIEQVLMYFHDTNFRQNNSLRDVKRNMITMQLEVIRRIMELAGKEKYGPLSEEDFVYKKSGRYWGKYTSLENRIAMQSPSFRTMGQDADSTIHIIKLAGTAEGDQDSLPNLHYTGLDTGVPVIELYDREIQDNQEAFNTAMNARKFYRRDESGNPIKFTSEDS